MSIIEKAINKLESEKGRDALLTASNPAEQHRRAEVPIPADALRTSEAPPLGDRTALYSAVPTSADTEVAPASLSESLPNDTAAAWRVDTSEVGTAAIHVLPIEEMDRGGLITPQRPRSLVADEYRAIKRPLLMNMEKKGPTAIENANLIMVTSALPGEGKTFSAINLAMSMATEQDRTVLLVDADVTKASAARILGISDDCPGLIDLLEDKTKKFSDVLIHTNIPKLRVLPAGHLHEHATELLASDNMKSLVRELSARYPDRVIIFDSPPLLITTEASVLASHVGQVVFVVASQQSSQDAVIEAIEHIGEDKVIGLVLNKVRKNPLSKHGYGYGYGYGYAYGEGSRRERHYQYSERESAKQRD